MSVSARGDVLKGVLQDHTEVSLELFGFNCVNALRKQVEDAKTRGPQDASAGVHDTTVEVGSSASQTETSNDKAPMKKGRRALLAIRQHIKVANEMSTKGQGFDSRSCACVRRRLSILEGRHGSTEQVENARSAKNASADLLEKVKGQFQPWEGIPEYDGTEESLLQIVKDAGHDISKFGIGGNGTMEQLHMELVNKEARLTKLKDGSLALERHAARITVRKLGSAVREETSRHAQILVETHQGTWDNKIKRLFKLPEESIRLDGSDSCGAATDRYCSEVLGVGSDVVRCSCGHMTKVHINPYGSDRYGTLPTVIHCHLVNVWVADLPDSGFVRDCSHLKNSTKGEVAKRYYDWFDENIQEVVGKIERQNARASNGAGSREVTTGASMDTQVEWKYERPDDIHKKNDEIALKTMFPTFAKVIAAKLHGGFSGSVVLICSGENAAGEPQLPSVVKLDDRSTVAVEYKRFRAIAPYLGENSPAVLATTLENSAEECPVGGIRFELAGSCWNDPALMRSAPIVTFKDLYTTTANNTDETVFGNDVFADLLREASCGKKTSLVETGAVLEKVEYAKYATRYVFGKQEEGKGARKLKDQVKEYYSNPDVKEAFGALMEHTGMEMQHRVGLVHGDLNGANIMIDSKDVVYIIDFAHTKNNVNVKDIAKMEQCLVCEYTSVTGDAEREDVMVLMDAALWYPDFFKPLPPFSSISHLVKSPNNYRLSLLWDTLGALRAYMKPYFTGVDPNAALMTYLAVLTSLYCKASSFRNTSTDQCHVAAYCSFQCARRLLSLIDSAKYPHSCPDNVKEALINAKVESTNFGVNAAKEFEEQQKRYLHMVEMKNGKLTDPISGQVMDIWEHTVNIEIVKDDRSLLEGKKSSDTSSSFDPVSILLPPQGEGADSKSRNYPMEKIAEVFGTLQSEGKILKGNQEEVCHMSRFLKEDQHGVACGRFYKSLAEAEEAKKVSRGKKEDEPAEGEVVVKKEDLSKEDQAAKKEDVGPTPAYSNCERNVCRVECTLCKVKYCSFQCYNLHHSVNSDKSYRVASGYMAHDGSTKEISCSSCSGDIPRNTGHLVCTCCPQSRFDSVTCWLEHHCEVLKSRNDLKDSDFFVPYLQDDNRFVALGPAASGKTVLMKRLSVEACRSLIDGQRKLIPYLVLLVDLARIVSTLRLSPTKDDFLKEYFYDKHGESSSRTQFLLEARRRRQLMLILDGMDETGLVMTEIVTYINEVLVPENIRILISSRPTGFRFDDFNAFKVVVLHPLSSENMFDLFRKRLPHGDSNVFSRSLEGLGAGVRALIETPLMFSLYLTIYEKNMENEGGSDSSLSSTRSELYRVGIDLMVKNVDAGKFERRRTEVDKEKQADLSVLSSAVEFLQTVAFDVHCNGVESRDITRPIIVRLDNRLVSGSGAISVWHAIERGVRAGRVPIITLVEDNPDQDLSIFRFNHLSFQEYLAAKQVCDDLYSAILAESRSPQDLEALLQPEGSGYDRRLAYLNEAWFDNMSRFMFSLMPPVVIGHIVIYLAAKVLPVPREQDKLSLHHDKEMAELQDNILTKLFNERAIDEIFDGIIQALELSGSSLDTLNMTILFQNISRTIEQSDEKVINFLSRMGASPLGRSLQDIPGHPSVVTALSHGKHGIEKIGVDLFSHGDGLSVYGDDAMAIITGLMELSDESKKREKCLKDMRVSIDGGLGDAVATGFASLVPLLSAGGSSSLNSIAVTGALTGKNALDIFTHCLSTNLRTLILSTSDLIDEFGSFVKALKRDDCPLETLTFEGELLSEQTLDGPQYGWNHPDTEYQILDFIADHDLHLTRLTVHEETHIGWIECGYRVVKESGGLGCVINLPGLSNPLSHETFNPVTISLGETEVITGIVAVKGVHDVIGAMTIKTTHRTTTIGQINHRREIGTAVAEDGHFIGGISFGYGGHVHNVRAIQCKSERLSKILAKRTSDPIVAKLDSISADCSVSAVRDALSEVLDLDFLYAPIYEECVADVLRALSESPRLHVLGVMLLGISAGNYNIPPSSLAHVAQSLSSQISPETMAQALELGAKIVGSEITELSLHCSKPAKFGEAVHPIVKGELPYLGASSSCLVFSDGVVDSLPNLSVLDISCNNEMNWIGDLTRFKTVRTLLAKDLSEGALLSVLGQISKPDFPMSRVSLAGTLISSENAQVLAEAVRANSSIQSLDLYDCGLHPANVGTLLDYIGKRAAALRELYIGDHTAVNPTLLAESGTSEIAEGLYKVKLEGYDNNEGYFNDYENFLAGVPIESLGNIASCKVYSRNNLGGIQCSWRVQGIMMHGPLNMHMTRTNEAFFPDEFKLGMSEFITGFSVYKGQWNNLGGMKIQTNKNKALSFGNCSGYQVFTARVPVGMKVAGFFGTCGGHMHGVGAMCRKVDLADETVDTNVFYEYEGAGAFSESEDDDCYFNERMHDDDDYQFDDEMWGGGYDDESDWDEDDW